MSEISKRLRQPCHMLDCLMARNQAADEIEHKDKVVGVLNTVLCSASAFMNCPAENHEELSKLAETLQESIDIATEMNEAHDKVGE